MAAPRCKDVVHVCAVGWDGGAGKASLVGEVGGKVGVGVAAVGANEGVADGYVRGGDRGCLRCGFTGWRFGHVPLHEWGERAASRHGASRETVGGSPVGSEGGFRSLGTVAGYVPGLLAGEARRLWLCACRGEGGRGLLFGRAAAAGLWQGTILDPVHLVAPGAWVWGVGVGRGRGTRGGRGGVAAGVEAVVEVGDLEVGGVNFVLKSANVLQGILERGLEGLQSVVGGRGAGRHINLGGDKVRVLKHELLAHGFVQGWGLWHTFDGYGLGGESGDAGADAELASEAHAAEHVLHCRARLEGDAKFGRGSVGWWAGIWRDGRGRSKSKRGTVVLARRKVRVFGVRRVDQRRARSRWPEGGGWVAWAYLAEGESEC